MLIKVNSKIYCLEAVLNACYAFIDRAYASVDTDKRAGILKVSLKPKKNLTLKQSQVLRDEFMNELLHSALRYHISKNNKKIREYIIGRAVCSPPDDAPSLPGNGSGDDYLSDPLGIAVPWEEKYGLKKKTRSRA